MSTLQPTSAAERLAALCDLASEHDEDYSYIEVEQLELASRRRLTLRETPTRIIYSERRTQRQV
jgi:hypothetical protein